MMNTSLKLLLCVFLLNMPISVIAQQEQAVLDRLADNSNYQTAQQAQAKEEWQEARLRIN